MRRAVLSMLVLSVFVESLGVGPVSIGRVLAVVGAFAAVLAVLAQPRTRVVPDPRVGIPAAGMAIWLFLGALWSPSLYAWAGAVLQLALALCYFTAYVVLIRSRQDVRALLLVFVAGAAVFAVVGLVQALQGIRATGLQGDPNTYALYEVCAVPIATALAGRSSGRARAAWFAVCVLLLAAVVASQSRGGLVAAVVTVLWLARSGDGGSTSRRERRWVLAGGLTAVIALVVLAVLAVPRFDLEAQATDRGTARLDIWMVAWKAWEQHPVLGLGPGNFEWESSQLLSQTPGVQIDPYSTIFDGIRIHNAYLEPWAEQGVIGFGFYVALLLGAAVILSRVRRQPGAGIIRSCLPMLLAFAVATVFLSAMNNKALWMLVGFAGALPYLPERPAKTTSEASLKELA